MIDLELVEKLREKTNISYEEAKETLEKTNGDLLEAVIYLEKQGKISPPPTGGFYSTQSGNPEGSWSSRQNEENAPSQVYGYNSYNSGKSFTDTIIGFGKRIIAFTSRLINKGNSNFLDMKKDGNIVVTLPMTAVVLLIIFAFYIFIPLCIIAIFFGYRLSFRGSDLDNTRVNYTMDRAAQATDNFREEIKQSMKKNE